VQSRMHTKNHPHPTVLEVIRIRKNKQAIWDSLLGDKSPTTFGDLVERNGWNQLTAMRGGGKSVFAGLYGKALNNDFSPDFAKLEAMAAAHQVKMLDTFGLLSDNHIYNPSEDYKNPAHQWGIHDEYHPKKIRTLGHQGILHNYDFPVITVRNP